MVIFGYYLEGFPLLFVLMMFVVIFIVALWPLSAVLNRSMVKGRAKAMRQAWDEEGEASGSSDHELERLKRAVKEAMDSSKER
jgi:Na+-transporting methylmalonyl-CoA/oxaloacetate decarboxylase gamma subunit